MNKNHCNNLTPKYITQVCQQRVWYTRQPQGKMGTFMHESKLHNMFDYMRKKIDPRMAEQKFSLWKPEPTKNAQEI